MRAGGLNWREVDWRRIIPWAALICAVYAVPAVIDLATIFILRRAVSPGLLRDLISLFFMSSLTANLEPGTYKAELLHPHAQARSISRSAILLAAALKALLTSVALAPIWRFGNPAMSADMLIWTPLMAGAGFLAAEIRIMHDVAQRYAVGLAFKHALLAVGFVITAALILVGVPLFWSAGVGLLVRLGLILGLSGLGGFACVAERGAWPRWENVRRLLADPRWLEFALPSGVGALASAADRIIAPRFLPATVFAAYFLFFEVLARFWLLPYFLSPVLFARRAVGQTWVAFARAAWMLLGLAGGGLIAGVIAIRAFWPAGLTRAFGADFGLAGVAFALAVVLGGVIQLRSAELQAAGVTRATAMVNTAAAVLSAGLFWICVQAYGAPGLLWAWLARMVLELAGLWLFAPIPRPSSAAESRL
jgi:hypothetical protein